MIAHLTSENFVGRRWAFGVADSAPQTTNLIFESDGAISNWTGKHEQFWRLNDGVFVILDTNYNVFWISKRVYFLEGSLHVDLFSLRLPNATFTLFECDENGHKGSGASNGLSDAGFLFPPDLSRADVNIKNVLVIGSCMSRIYCDIFGQLHPETTFRNLVFNNASKLEEVNDDDLANIDFQYIQMPARSVVSDRIARCERILSAAILQQTLEDGCNYLDQMLMSALSYNKSHGLLTFVANFIVPQINASLDLACRGTHGDIAYLFQRLNEHLASRIAGTPNVYLVDVDGLASSMGKRYILDDITGFYGHNTTFHIDQRDLAPGIRYEQLPEAHHIYQDKHATFFKAVYEQCLASYRTINRIDAIKAVVFDLDNTLWRGLIAEDFGEGSVADPGAWQSGVLEAIQHLRARGIFTAICSKNDEVIVRKNWERAVQPPFAQLEDFTVRRINWKPKSENIAEIASELNIGMDSILFVDDNPVERQEVQSAYPQIRVTGSNPYYLRRLLLWAPETNVPHITEEATLRDNSIRARVAATAASLTQSREAFLSSLEVKVRFKTIRDIDSADMPRVHELVNKTNQFNTTGERWELAGIKSFLDKGGWIFSFSVGDRFADHGLVGAGFVEGNNLLQLVMSCRVLGMEVERAAIAYFCRTASEADRNAPVFGQMVHTERNGPCRQLYDDAGFTKIEEQSGSRIMYRLDDAAAQGQFPPHIQVQGFE